MPRIRILGAMLCADDGEAEGWTLHFRWGRFIVEFTVASYPGVADK